jgi:hypothetical protein
MKKIGVILSLMVCGSAYAADSSNPYKPTIAMIDPQTGEGYLAGMPAEIQSYILTAVTQSRSLKGTAAAVYTHAQVNKQFNTVINDPRNIKKLIGMLADKFGETREQVAVSLRIPRANEYLKVNQEFLAKYANKNLPVEQIKAYMPIIDINYVTVFGHSVLYYAVLYNQLEVITLLLDNRLGQTTINAKLVAGQFPTVLCMALHMKRYAVAELLIAYGAEIFIGTRIPAKNQVQQYLTETYGADILTHVPNLLEAAQKELEPRKQ